MPSFSIRVAIRLTSGLLAMISVTAVASATAQHAEHTVPGAPAGTATAPTPATTALAMPLFRDALGPFSRKTGSAVQNAQLYFDQGMQLMYSFARPEAVRSFREAQRHDSTCAACFWGEAWSRGPYLNSPMDSADAAHAYAAAQKASSLAAKYARPVDRALIGAMVSRYRPTYNRSERRSLDSAYSQAMAQVHKAFPQDDDVATLYAESLMLLEPRRGVWNVAKPSINQIHEVLATVVSRNRAHPGACHLYVHATETTPRAGNAESCAELLGSSIPGASHINHMPSHTFNRIGRWGDAVRANLVAFHTDQRSAEGSGFAIYPAHNLHMLLFSASMDGQGAVAEQAARDYAKIVPGGDFYRALVLLRFGRFDEIQAMETAPAQPILRGLWEFARGYSHLRVGDADNARAYLERVERTMRTTPDSLTMRGHTASALLGIASGILRGELLRKEGKLDEAIVAFERAVVLEQKLQYDEPEPLNFSATDWLGAALLEKGRAVDAERVYRMALEHRPRNGWSLKGLEQALVKQGKTADAAVVRRQFETAWARSDTWIKASRF